jgi:flagellar biogenesis protein FliO
MTTEIITAFSALLFVLAILGLISWAVKRFGLLPGHSPIKSGDKSIKITETKMIDTKTRLLEAEWDGVRYFLGVSHTGIDVIDKRPKDADKQTHHADVSEATE